MAHGDSARAERHYNRAIAAGGGTIITRSWALFALGRGEAVDVTELRRRLDEQLTGWIRVELTLLFAKYQLQSKPLDVEVHDALVDLTGEGSSRLEQQLVALAILAEHDVKRGAPLEAKDRLKTVGPANAQLGFNVAELP